MPGGSVIDMLTPGSGGFGDPGEGRVVLRYVEDPLGATERVAGERRRSVSA